jgi:hypothetical protein
MTRWFGGIKANRMPDRLSVYMCVLASVVGVQYAFMDCCP